MSAQWSDRAWLSRRANGMPDSALHMAVLLQEVIPADFAFVLHTANPLTGKSCWRLVVGKGSCGGAASLALAIVKLQFLISLPLPPGDRDELLGQVVTGLGEVLVGNSPGSALTFAVKQIAEPAAILCFPSKTMSVHLLGGESTLIARSDSNGEDLEVCMPPLSGFNDGI